MPKTDSTKFLDRYIELRRRINLHDLRCAVDGCKERAYIERRLKKTLKIVNDRTNRKLKLPKDYSDGFCAGCKGTGVSCTSPGVSSMTGCQLCFRKGIVNVIGGRLLKKCPLHPNYYLFHADKVNF